jgi:hypothetical protein
MITVKHKEFVVRKGGWLPLFLSMALGTFALELLVQIVYGWLVTILAIKPCLRLQAMNGQIF